MKKRICLVLFLFLFMSVNARAENIFMLYLSVYKTNAVDLQSFELTDGKINVFPSAPGEYTMKILSGENSELFVTALQLQFYAYADEIDEQGNMHSKRVELEKVETLLRLPYFQNAERIELYRNGAVIFTLNLAEKLCIGDGECPEYCTGKGDVDCGTSRTTTITTLITTTTAGCGNRVCEKNENFASCPQDCKSGGTDSYCDGESDTICDPDCKPELDPDCKISFCGNKNCDLTEGENFASCPQDCLSGGSDSYCDGTVDGKCDSDCTQDEDSDCKKTDFSFYVLLLVAIVLIIAIIFFLRRRRREY